MIRSFLGGNLIDDLTVSIVPVLLGDDIRLFDDSVPPRTLCIAGGQAFPSGLVQLTYEAQPA